MNINTSSIASSSAQPKGLNSTIKTPAVASKEKAEDSSQVQDGFVPSAQVKDKHSSFLASAGSALAMGAIVGAPTAVGGFLKSTLGTGKALAATLALGPSVGALAGVVTGAIIGCNTVPKEQGEVWRYIGGAVGAIAGGVAGGVGIPALTALGAWTGYAGAAVAAGATAIGFAVMAAKND